MMTFRSALVALLLAATPLAAQEVTAPAPAPAPAPAVAPVLTPSAAPALDVDCTDEASVLAEMERRELQEMVAVREFCVDELIRLANALGPNATGEDAFKAALNRLDLEIATLKIFQADLLSGGRIDNALRRTQTEIDSLDEEVRLQRERGSADVEDNAQRLEEMRVRYTENKASMDRLKSEVDEGLAGLLDNAPDIALKIRLDGLDAAIASQEVVVTSTRTLMDAMLTLRRDITQGQETN